jgi:phenylacetate-CoA ligase
MRKEYEKFFNCRLTNLYGTNETGFVGWECPAGSRMHVEEDFAFTEVLKTDSDEPVPEGELGRLVITSMKSWQMPIIRYDTGDLAAIREVRCICGHTTKIIERLEGRHSITFLGSDLSPIGPAHITDVLKRQDVPRFQVTQNKIGEIVINLGPNWTREALSRLGEELASEWEGLNGKLNIQMISEQFYYAPSGKFNLCVSFIPQTPSHVG